MDDLLVYARIAIAVVYGCILLILAGIVYAVCLLIFSPQVFRIDLITGFAPFAVVVLIGYCLTPLLLSRLGII